MRKSKIQVKLGLIRIAFIKKSGIFLGKVG